MNKKLSYLFIAILLIGTVVGYAAAQMSIGTLTPDPSAALDIVSTTQGVLHPRLSTAERDAINSGTFAEGLTIYNTDDKCLQVWDGTSWQCIVGGATETSSDFIISTGGTSPTVVVGAALPRSPSRSTDVHWLSNDELSIVENYQYVGNNADLDHPPFADQVVATIYNKNLQLQSRFTLPDDPGYTSAGGFADFLVVKLQNDNFMFAVGTTGAGGAALDYRLLITQQDGTVVSPWQTVAPITTGLGSNGLGVQDLILLDNGNVVMTGYEGNGRPVSFVLQEDGTLIRQTRFIASQTQNMSSARHGVAATNFGYAIICECHGQGFTSGPWPVLFEMYDFDGNVVGTPTFESDSTNPFGPVQASPNQPALTVGLVRGQGNTLFATVKRPRDGLTNVGNGSDEYTEQNPAQDQIISGLRQFEANSDGTINVLNDIELVWEAGTPRVTAGNYLTTFPDGRLLAIGAKIPDLWPAGIDDEFNVATNITDDRHNGSSLPILHVDVNGAFTGVTRFGLDGVNNRGNTRELSLPWLDYYTSTGLNGSGVPHHILLSPDGQTLFSAMHFYDEGYFYTTFDLSSGELVPYSRTLVGNNTAQDLPKTFYVYTVYDENIDQVDITITSGAGTFDALNCPNCGSAGISSNYDVANKVLTLTKTASTATSDDFAAALRFLTLSPDGAGTRTLEARGIDVAGNFSTATIDIEVVAP